MKKLFVSMILILLFFAACSSRHRYVPVVKYAKPSSKALKIILHGTYGDRYVWAGQGPNRFDCSGLIYYSYATMNLWLPRRAIDQARAGKRISASQLRYGDLIFFDTRRRARSVVNHVGIYMGHGYFLHASSAKRRVVLSSLRKPFYARRVVAYRRVIPLYQARLKKVKHTKKVKRRRRVECVVKAPPKKQRVIQIPRNSTLF